MYDYQEESCLALASDFHEPGTVWNDIACYHEKVHFINPTQDGGGVFDCKLNWYTNFG